MKFPMFRLLKDMLCYFITMMDSGCTHLIDLTLFQNYSSLGPQFEKNLVFSNLH